MKEFLNKMRKDYAMMGLEEKEMDASPIVQFESWMVDAANAEVNEPNAMVLSTVDEKGYPHSRIVLLRNVSNQGFSFFTNYESDKGKQIEQNPVVALNFFWPDVERQVRIEGVAQKIGIVESKEYFQSRPRESQISAWTSPQSQVLESRAMLDALWHEMEEKWKNEPEIEKPPFWGGMVVKPTSIEFWQGRPGRLHDRIRYRLHEENWIIERLAP